MKNNYLKSVIVLVSICLIVGLLLSGVNAITAPIIKKNDEAAANGAYMVVLPDATSFEDVTGEFPETVLEMKKDTGGSGFAFKLQGSSSYSQSPLQMILGINNEGKITKLVITNYAETKGTAADFEPLFEGKDATMTDVVAGVTYTTTAIKDVVKDAYDVFYEYADIEKSDEQKLQELCQVIMPGAIKADASSKMYNFTPVDLPEGAPTSITAIYAPDNGIGYVMGGLVGETPVAIGVNAFGKAYYISDLDGNDLSADAAYDQVKLDAEAVFAPINTSEDEKNVKALKKMLSDSANLENLTFEGINSTVVAVYKVKDADVDGYAYIAQTVGYGGTVKVCYILNTNGDIIKAKTLSHNESEYFGEVIGESSYYDKVNGQTVDTLTDETFTIGRSTFTSNAMKLAWNDIKAAAEIVNGEVK